MCSKPLQNNLVWKTPHLFLLKPANTLEGGAFRDTSASQVPLFKDTHWENLCLWDTLQSLLPQPLPDLLIQQSQLFWAPHSLSLQWAWPTADHILFSFNCLAWACCPGSSTSWWHVVGTTRDWLRGSRGILGDGGAASYYGLYFPFPGCRQDTGVQPRPDPNV